MENKLIGRITEEKLAAEKQITLSRNTSSYWFGRLALANELLKLYKENNKLNIKSKNESA